ncbi:MAG: two-component system sensor kinase FixL, partial [Gammaproteobacteria bacterium]
MAEHPSEADEATQKSILSLVQNLPGMAYRCENHRDWPMQFVSEGCSDLSGYSRQDFEKQHVLWGSLVHADDRDRIWHSTQEAILSNKPFEYEYRILTKAHEHRWVWERGQLSSRANGSDKGVFLEGIISDITERKTMEEALADAVAFADAVVETAAEAVITIDVDGSIETFNRAAQSMFAYSLEEIRGKNIRVLMPEPYHSEHDRYLERYLQTNEAKIIGIGREVRAQRKDGTIFPIHLSVSEVNYHPRRKFVGLIRDMSMQHEAERAEREHVEQLAHVDRLNMLGEMAAGIAHEINQPLTAISLFSQAGKRLLDAAKFDRLPDIFDKLSQHAHRAGDIIERMQTMARRGESSREISEVNELIEEIAKLAEAETRIRDVDIRLELGAGLPLVNVDAVQIQQVALNLLRNGMEAMRSIDCAAGNMIVLKTGLRGDGDVEITVIDSGCGVSDV